WSTPLTNPDDFRPGSVRGVAIVGTGLGHAPRRCLDAIAALTKAGVLVTMSSQCLWGRVDLNVYSTGRDLLARGVVPSHDMLPEVALVKLMWALGQAKDAAAARALFETVRAD